MPRRVWYDDGSGGDEGNEDDDGDEGDDQEEGDDGVIESVHTVPLGDFSKASHKRHGARRHKARRDDRLCRRCSRSTRLAHTIWTEGLAASTALSVGEHQLDESLCGSQGAHQERTLLLVDDRALMAAVAARGYHQLPVSASESAVDSA